MVNEPQIEFLDEAMSVAQDYNTHSIIRTITKRYVHRGGALVGRVFTVEQVERIPMTDWMNLRTPYEEYKKAAEEQNKRAEQARLYATLGPVGSAVGNWLGDKLASINY